ncbi:hypothetical protein BKH41_05860 [Helicobacter sp. 12S02232-10]|uniref:peptidylprolyl isomerase n=1 Tax=Helicobacter sp. 12S02232-10 TaxID=1476197 RepID=UPI000BA60E37|nr:peptidylprolyl isomerase [Helicobacter sp. 12S02232-10]PAF48238.1 hypothetical protein BKH41_05860 [Helicobacter sp. 12S02232-10]
MIEWMQKHKKYLVVTIWISTIAFIAAGMIGWGQYNFSISGDSVAKVGQIKISSQELAQEYNRFYEAYAQAFQDFNEEQAKAMGLENSALNFLINQALLRNFALDLGLRVEDSEVIDEITQNEAFQNNGHFDENLYKNTLKENHYRLSDFEENVRNALLLQKITALLPKTITPLELSAVSSGLKLQDKIEILILDAKNIKPKISPTELKEFWEKNKTKYQKPTEFQIQSIFIDSKSQPFTPEEIQEYYNQNKSLYLNDKGELESIQTARKKIQKDVQMQKAQAQALKEYLKLKKGEAQKVKNQTFSDTSHQYSPIIMQELQKAKINDTIKPQPYEDGYIVIKLAGKKDARPKDFEEAKSEALTQLQSLKKIQLLKIEAQNKLDTFKGKDIGFVYPNFKGKIEGLDEKEVAELMAHIFNSNKKSNFAIINKKAVLYKINQQNFKNKLQENDESFMVNATENLKTNYLDQTLIDYLRQKYAIKRY